MKTEDLTLILGFIFGSILGSITIYNFVSTPEVVTVTEIKIECYTQTIKANNSLLHRVKCPRVSM